MDNQTEQNVLRLVTVEVTQAIAQALEMLIHKKGFEVPIYMAAIGSNGYTYAVKYQQKAEGTALEAKELAEHAPDEEGARFPINMLFVDCRGNGARVLVNAPMSEEETYIDRRYIASKTYQLISGHGLTMLSGRGYSHLTLDMYEDSYHMDYVAKATAYVVPL